MLVSPYFFPPCIYVYIYIWFLLMLVSPHVFPPGSQEYSNVYAYRHTYIHIYVYMYIHIYVNIYLHVCVCFSDACFVFFSLRIPRIFTYLYIYMCIYMYIYMCIYVYTYIFWCLFLPCFFPQDPKNIRWRRKLREHEKDGDFCSMLQCVVVCCSVLQCYRLGQR